METATEKLELHCTVNGRRETFHAYPMERLLDVLREQLHLTGTKEGCGEGECGACSVFINGHLVNSCLVPVAQVNDAEIKTIEGVAGEQQLHAVQQAFIDSRRCAMRHLHAGNGSGGGEPPGKNSNPSEADIRTGLAEIFVVAPAT